jgi:hypothetical protein
MNTVPLPAEIAKACRRVISDWNLDEMAEPILKATKATLVCESKKRAPLGNGWPRISVPMLDAQLTPDCLHLNGSAIASAGPAAFFYEILGTPSRFTTGGTPAPAGHRNNQIHIYDALGVTLNEHHYTYQVTAITFVFATDESPFPPAQHEDAREEWIDCQGMTQ